MNVLAEFHYLIGSNQRKCGNYTSKTLEHFRLAYSISKKPSHLIPYARLLRDMTGDVPEELLKELHSALTKKTTKNQKSRIHSLLQEALDIVNKEVQATQTQQSEYSLNDFRQQQTAWRIDLKRYIKGKSIAVVGNSASISNTGYGKLIDSHDIVCRFNRYPAGEKSQYDLGQRVDIWVTSAEVLNESITLPAALKWIVLTGADARYTLLNMDKCLKYLQQGVKLVTFPLHTWSILVKALEAPPSAGMLWLSYLTKETYTHIPIQTFGFDSAQCKAKLYHIGSTKYLPSKRHAWTLEKETLNNLALTGVISINTPKRYAVFTRGLAANTHLKRQLATHTITFKPKNAHNVEMVAGWGRKPNTEQAKVFALKNTLPYITLEDGFIHSMSQGRLGAKSWSLVVDKTGIFYDATQASDLENLIKTTSLTTDQRARAQYCIATITENNITKYNNSPLEISTPFTQYKNPILVLDQVKGDMSIPYAIASPASFQDMLDAAIDENPNADILIKRHPDVINGKRKGCINLPQTLPSNIHIISDNINPLVLIKHVNKVYVVSSQVGFEALMLGKEVICFGAPFYSSWGLTSDRFDNTLPVVKRRNCKPDIYIIFFAAYITYSRYLDPIHSTPCEIETVLTHVKQQYDLYKKNTGQFICIGLTPWKRRFIQHYLQGPSNQICFIKSTKDARKLEVNQKTKLLIWSNKHESSATEITKETNAKIVRLEDGFLRSVNLGSNYTLPSSLVLDEQGIYFDPSKPSELEKILNNTSFSEKQRNRAKLLREQIIALGVSKYNIGGQNLIALPDKKKGKKLILIPGQVADDASIKLGCKDIKTNLKLLEAVRVNNPDAYIIYKPHPDVVSGNRSGAILEINALKYCDQIIENQNITTCLDFADEVHTLTSLVGFEALMRGLVVHCYGIPFYANWGLTKDRHSLKRRHRKLTIDELTAGTLIIYPRYYDWTTNSFITAEGAVEKLHQQSQTATREKNQSIYTQKIAKYLNLFRALIIPPIR